jgi:phosphoribosylformimino-5-aminoimidazole carboxamide ribotide isomerase
VAASGCGDGVLIPSIDLKGGRIVQLVQGESLALESTDVDGWIDRFRGFDAVQLIDLDAAMALGNNDVLVRYIASELPCRVGGGVHSAQRAHELINAGATHVIVGSSLYRGARANDPHGQCINLDFAKELVREVGAPRVIGAVDSKAGHVVIHGWKTTLPLTAVEAVRTLEPYCGEFLYTHVDREGLMQGTDIPAILDVARATTRPVTAAGGITTREEIDQLHRHGVHAVVGMAIYTGLLTLDQPATG